MGEWGNGGMGEWGSGVDRGEERAGRQRGWEGKDVAREGVSIKAKVNTYRNICLPRGLEGLLLVLEYSSTVGTGRRELRKGSPSLFELQKVEIGWKWIGRTGSR